MGGAEAWPRLRAGAAVARKGTRCSAGGAEEGVRGRHTFRRNQAPGQRRPSAGAPGSGGVQSRNEAGEVRRENNKEPRKEGGERSGVGRRRWARAKGRLRGARRGRGGERGEQRSGGAGRQKVGMA